MENEKSRENLENEDLNEDLKKEVEPTLEEKNALLLAEVNEWKKEYKIKLADFENYKKRKDKEFEEYKKYACEDLIKKEIESLDILTMAINSAENSGDIKSLLEGLNMLKNTIFNNLVNEGLTEIETENIEYDPYQHHAVSTVNDENLENDVIVNVLQKGYKLKNKIIRPAMVTINKK